MERIDEITLHNVVPQVLAEDVVSSGVWLCDMSFERGTSYCIDAASGTGKTSLCSFLFGIRGDYDGVIWFNNVDIRQLDTRKWCGIRRCHIAYLTQELDIFGELTALENVMLKNRLTGFRTQAEISHMFEELGIENRIYTPAAKMSVGQRQRVALIRALCQPFDFILLDEPVSHLDSGNNKTCAEMVAREAARQDAGVIFTSVGNRLAIDNPVILKL